VFKVKKTLLAGSVRIESSVSKELWNSPWVLALFWLFLAGEWFLRRWKGFF
jgi:hypothetical protein